MAEHVICASTRVRGAAGRDRAPAAPLARPRVVPSRETTTSLVQYNIYIYLIKTNLGARQGPLQAE